MPNIFRRSLIKIGNGALVVVIPRPWAEYNGLESGDVVEVRTNKNLVVNPKVIGKSGKDRRHRNALAG